MISTQDIDIPIGYLFNRDRSKLLSRTNTGYCISFSDDGLKSQIQDTTQVSLSSFSTLAVWDNIIARRFMNSYTI
jgi:hypothetical protein